MTTIAQLTIEMAANVARLAQDMARARSIVDGAMTSIRASADMAMKALGGIAAGMSVREFVQAADAVTQLQNRLKLATGSAQAAASAYSQLFEVAQRSRVSFTDLGATYATIARTTKDLGLGQAQLLTVTEAIGNAMTISGGSAESMNAALVQLGQGLGSGTLRGEELNSVMEQTPRLAQAIADGMGITIGQLRQYAQDGKLSAEAVTQALQSQASVLANEVQDATLTVAQAMTVARNSATAFVGAVDASTNASSVMAQTIQEASRHLDALSAAFISTKAEASPLAQFFSGAFAVAMETISVLAVNVVYVFRQVVNEIRGITSQAKALLSLDFSGAAGISQKMREDAAKARAEVDATTARILNASKVAASLKDADSYNEPRFARAMQAAEQSATRAVPAIAKVGAAKRAAGSAARATVDEFKKLSDALKGDLVSGAAAAEAAQHGYNKAQAEFLTLAKSPEWAKLTGDQRAQVASLMEQKIAQEQATDARKLATEAAAAQAKAEADLVKQYVDSAAGAAQRLQGMQDEAAAMAYAERYQVSMARAVEETTLARLREQLVAKESGGANAAVVQALKDEIAAREQIVQAIAGNDVKAAADKLRKDEAAEWDRTWGQVAQSFTDALMQGGQSVKQYLENLFRTLVLRPLLDPIGKGFAGLLGGGGSASAFAGQGGGGLMDLLSSGSSLKSAWGALSGGVNTLGSTSIANGVGALGGDSLGTLANLQGAGSSGMAALGTAANYLGGAMVGIMAGKMISGGYSALGKSGNAATIGGTAIGALLGGPIGAAIGGAVGGLVNRAFGRKAPVTQSEGITGTFSSSGADVQGYRDQFAKGGWFRSNKSWTEYSALDAGTTGALNDSLKYITAATQSYAGILGLNAEQINGITQAVRIDLKGLDAEQRQAKVAEALSGFGDRLAQELLGTFETTTKTGTNALSTAWARMLRRTTTTTTWVAGEFVRQGETAGQALQRLATSLVTVNGTLATLGDTLLATSLRGGDAASKLVDLFGGLEQFSQATGAYYAAYYSDAEKTAAATAQLSAAMAALGVHMPASRDAFRDLVTAQDLTTESGRQTYAALVQLAPAFAEVDTAARQVADAAAQRLLAAFTGPTGLVSAMGSMSGALATTIAAAAEFTGPVSTIHRLLGDASSGVLTFGERVQTATSELTPAQAAVATLQGQVLALRTAASGTVVDIQGLTAALKGVDTQTFTATVVGVFDRIGQRVKDTLSSIADERVAVREAAAAIIGPGVMSAQQIRAGIASSMVGMPSSAGLASAQAKLSSADASVAQLTAQQARAQSAIGTAEQAQAATVQRLVSAQQQLADLANRNRVAVNAKSGAVSWANDAFAYNAATNRLAGYGQISFNTRKSNVAAFKSEANKAGGLVEQLSGGNAALARDERALAAARAAAATTAQQLAAAQQAQAAATAAAKQAQLDYVASLQKYSLDASKAVTQLGRLREETVRYYESQQQLASLMSGTATSLRDTVAAFRFDQLDPAQQLASLQERYNVAYSMALSTTGETLAGYGAEMNALINPLLQKAQEAGLSGTDYSNLVNTVLARAEATADRLDANAPKDYQAESLGLLGQIDSTLAALEQGAMSADQLIVKAIDAGKDTTRDGFRAVIAALTGQTVPAFALGGMHSGGLRLVGENGPELEVTGPARIYNAADTARMLRGGGNGHTARLEALVEQQTQQLEAMRREMQVLQTQIVVNTGKAARQLDRWDGDGLPVKNADGTALATEGATA